MQKLIALLVVTLSFVNLHAQGVWIEENIDLSNNSRTGRIQVNGGTYTIEFGAELSGANLRGADLSGTYLRFADLRGADFSRANLTDANLRNANLSGANLSDARLEDTNFALSIWNTPDPRIAELEAQLAAVTAERDAAISERDARPTLEEVQDARAGSLVFRANEGANLVDLRFFIESSENLQDWEITGECNFLLPMDTGKKFLRIALR